MAELTNLIKLLDFGGQATSFAKLAASNSNFSAILRNMDGNLPSILRSADQDQFAKAYDDLTAEINKAGDSELIDAFKGYKKADFINNMTVFSDSQRLDDAIWSSVLKDGKIDIDSLNVNNGFPNAGASEIDAAKNFATQLEQTVTHEAKRLAKEAGDAETGGYSEANYYKAFMDSARDNISEKIEAANPDKVTAVKAADDFVKKAEAEALSHYTDFPKFDPKLDMFKVKAHVSTTDNTIIPLPKPNLFTVTAMRSRSYGITRPVLDYVSGKMHDAGIVDGFQKLNNDVLATRKNGGNPKSIIDDFAKNNKESLEEFSLNMKALKKHIEDTYHTNADMNGTIKDGKLIPGKDSVRWKDDLTIPQKEALIAYIEDMGKIALDVLSGTNGKNSQEMLSNLAKIRSGELSYNAVKDSMTGLSRTVEIANYEQIRKTGRWLDDSNEATKQHSEQLIRGINVGFYSNKPHSGTPLLLNLNTSENIEKTWQDFVEGYTKIGEDGKLVIDLHGDVKPIHAFLSDIDTVIGAGLPAEAIFMTEQITRVLQHSKRGSSVKPFPDDSEFMSQIRHTGRGDADPRTAEVYNQISEVFRVGTERIKGQSNKSLLGFKETFLEDNRRALTIAEQESYFLETFERHGKKSDGLGSGAGYPAWLDIKSRFFHDGFYNPLSFVVGGKMDVPVIDALGKQKKNYFGETFEWRYKDAEGNKESILNPVGRAAARASSLWLVDGFQKPSITINPATLFGVRTTKLGSIAVLGGALWAGGNVLAATGENLDSDLLSGVGEAAAYVGQPIANTVTLPAQFVYEEPIDAVASLLGYKGSEEASVPDINVEKSSLTEDLESPNSLNDIDDIKDASDDVIEASEEAITKAQKLVLELSAQKESYIMSLNDAISQEDKGKYTQLLKDLPTRQTAAATLLKNMEDNHALLVGRDGAIQKMDEDKANLLPNAQQRYANELAILNNSGHSLDRLSEIQNNAFNGIVIPKTPVTAPITPVSVAGAGGVTTVGATQKPAVVIETAISKQHTEADKNLAEANVEIAKYKTSPTAAAQIISTMDDNIKTVERVRDGVSRTSGTDTTRRIEILDNTIEILENKRDQAEEIQAKIKAGLENPLKLAAFKALETAATEQHKGIKGITDNAGAGDAKARNALLAGTVNQLEAMNKDQTALLRQMNELGLEGVKVAAANDDIQYDKSASKKLHDGAVEFGGEHGLLAKLFTSGPNDKGMFSGLGDIFSGAAGTVKGWVSDLKAGSKTAEEDTYINIGLGVASMFAAMLTMNTANDWLFGGKMGGGLKFAILGVAAIFIAKQTGVWGEEMSHNNGSNKTFSDGRFSSGKPYGSSTARNQGDSTNIPTKGSTILGQKNYTKQTHNGALGKSSIMPEEENEMFASNTGNGKNLPLGNLNFKSIENSDNNNLSHPSTYGQNVQPTNPELAFS